MNTPLTAWVLLAMLRVQPTAPWIDTYPSTAEAIATAATDEPLFQGEDGAKKTAAILTSVAWYEGTFKQNAEGDHIKLADGRKGRPRSFCTMQIHETNFRYLGVTKDQVQEDIGVCIRSALRLMRISFTLCKQKGFEHLLDQYTTGTGGCRAPKKNEGVHRMRKGMWLFNNVHEDVEGRET